MFMPAKFANQQFEVTQDPDQQVNEVNELVRKEPRVFKFKLMIANAARTNTMLFPYRNQWNGTITQTETIEDLFPMIEDTAGFALKLSKLLESDNVCKDSIEEQFSNARNFYRDLHYILFTSIYSLRESTAKWYLYLKKAYNIHIFDCVYSQQEEADFRADNRTSQFFFHGTSPCNLYSILRNGISLINHSAVYMSKFINVSLGYSLGVQKVLLYFETKHFSIKNYGFAATSQPQYLRLRSVIWFTIDNVTAYRYLSPRSQPILQSLQANLADKDNQLGHKIKAAMQATKRQKSENRLWKIKKAVKTIAVTPTVPKAEPEKKNQSMPRKLPSYARPTLSSLQKHTKKSEILGADKWSI